MRSVGAHTHTLSSREPLVGCSFATPLLVVLYRIYSGVILVLIAKIPSCVVSICSVILTSVAESSLFAIGLLYSGKKFNLSDKWNTV